MIRGRQTLLAGSRSSSAGLDRASPVERSVTGRTSVGSAAATAGEAAIARTTGPVAGLDRGKRRRHPLRVAVEGLVVACGERAVEGVEDAGERDEDRDHGGDAEQAHQRPPRRAGEVAEGHLGEAASRAGGAARAAARARLPEARERADADRGDGRDADGAEDGVGGGEERDGEAERGGARVDARQQRRLPGGKREEVLQGAAEEPVEDEADADPDGDAEQRDLGGEEQGADRELRRGDAERHPDPDLAPLRLDDAADEVEGGESGAREEQPGEHVDHPLVAAGVLVEDAVDVLVGLAGDRDADVREPRRQGLPQLALDQRRGRRRARARARARSPARRGRSAPAPSPAARRGRRSRPRRRSRRRGG